MGGGAVGAGGHGAADWRLLIEQSLVVLWPDLPDGWRWIVAQCQVESGGDPRAVSPAGAIGLLQLMPATAVEMGVLNSFDPAQNLQGGIKYLRRQYEALHHVLFHADRLCWSFAAYNAGRGYIDFDGGPVNTCLELARRDCPGEWWKWKVGRYWLMHRDLVVRGRRPDYLQVWNYVARIEREFAQLAGSGAA
jgi:hypothetical protein